MLVSHEGGCAGEQPIRQVLNRAVHIFMDMVHKFQAVFYVSADNHPTLKDVSVSGGVVRKYSVPYLWEKHPPRGESLGTNHVGRYVSDIQNFFARSSSDKGCKMSAGQIRECLMSKYRGSYDIPVVIHITAAISKLHTSGARSGEIVPVAQPMHYNTSRRGVTSAYAEKLKELVCADMKFEAREAHVKLMDCLGLSDGTIPEDFPTEAMVRSKVYSFKTSMKRTYNNITL